MLKDAPLTVSKDCSQINCLGPHELVSRVVTICNRYLGFPTIRSHGEGNHIYCEYNRKGISATLFTKTGKNGSFLISVWLESPFKRRRNNLADSLKREIHKQLQDETISSAIYLPFE